MKVLMFAGSLRKDSFNKKLIINSMNFLSKISKVELEYLDFGPLTIPIYNEDLEKASGLPPDVQKICNKITSSNAIILSTPEYNGSIPGGLKNIIDWVSRDKSNPWKKKHLLLLAASPGKLGGIRSLWHTRVPFEALGCYVYPDMFGLSSAHEAFDSEGNLKEERTRLQLEGILKSYLEFIEK